MWERRDLGLRGERVIQGKIRMRREKKQEKGKKIPTNKL